MDSFSQTYPGFDDETQQAHWQEETRKLWIEATAKNSTFDFKTIGKYLSILDKICKNTYISEFKQILQTICSFEHIVS